MRRTKRVVGLSLSLAAFLAASAVAAADAQDEKLQLRIQKKLSGDELQGVRVTVDGDTVTLEGQVPSIWYQEKAVDTALKMREIVGVEDRLVIAEAESDKQLFEEVAKKIRRYAHYTIFDDIRLKVEQGAVTLDGRVTMPYKSKEIAKIAAKVLGVSEVTNGIQTLSVSRHDNDLRRRIAYRLYTDSVFFPYANRVNPPVHIVVENGRVTLTGVVNSKVEKYKAEHIARAQGPFSVDNQIQLGS